MKTPSNHEIARYVTMAFLTVILIDILILSRQNQIVLSAANLVIFSVFALALWYWDDEGTKS